MERPVSYTHLVSVVQELLRYRDVAGLAMEVLNSKIRFLEKPTDSMTTRKRLYPDVYKRQMQEAAENILEENYYGEKREILD